MIKFVMSNQNLPKTVSASDVEKYGYCPLSWWLSEQHPDGDAIELKKGIETHTNIGKDVNKIKSKEQISKESEKSVLWFSLIALIIGINGLAIVYTEYAPSQQREAIMIVLSIIALIWVFVAAISFYIGFRSERRQKRSTLEPASEPEIETEVVGGDHPKKDLDYKKRFSEAKWNTVMFFIVSSFLAANGLIILLNIGEDHSELFSLLFLVFSLIWLIGSFFFYYISLKREIVRKTRDQDARRLRRSFTDSEISIVLFAVVATILASNSLTLFQSPSTNIGWIVLAVAILWMYGGFIFLYRALRANLKLRLLIHEEFKDIKDRKERKPFRIPFALENWFGEIDYERRVTWFAIVAMILALNAILMNLARNLEEEIYGTLIAHVFEIVALLWLIGASFFLYFVLVHSRTAKKLRDEHGISDGKIEYVDTLDGGSKMLVSEKYHLRGRPDYVLEKEGNMVPVEVKTGRVPRGPLFSHILQLGAYCLLIEERYGKRPPHGIIKYTNIQHEIEFTDELRGILISKLNQMQKIMKTGEAHRNHKRPNKCRGCSRRGICPETLV